MSGYSVTVDLDQVERLTYEGEEALHNTGHLMHEVCADTAERERAQHRYQNRTSNTEQGTFANIPMVVGHDTVEVELAMRTEYSSFLVARDFSDFPDLVEECKSNCQTAFENERDRLNHL